MFERQSAGLSSKEALHSHDSSVLKEEIHTACLEGFGHTEQGGSTWPYASCLWMESVHVLAIGNINNTACSMQVSVCEQVNYESCCRTSLLRRSVTGMWSMWRMSM